MFIYREEYYLKREEPDSSDAKHLAWLDKVNKVHGIAEVIIGKQRHGPIGTVRLHFNEDTTTFSNLVRKSEGYGEAG
jgi:replicative DNA helicase